MNAQKQATAFYPPAGGPDRTHYYGGDEMSKWTNEQMSIRAQGRIGRSAHVVLSQLTHTIITVVILVALLLGAARAGALNGVLTPLAAPADDTSFTTINYQGRLADGSGTPIDNTNPGLGMTFALYDVQSGGSPLWSETHANVPVAEGLFSVRLGSINALSTGHLSGDRWLGLQVGTDPEMSPREKLAAVPYAMMAGTVSDGAIGTDQIADGAVTSSKLDTHLCCGHTNTDGSGWVSYQGPEKAIYIDVDTSACGFPTVPMYLTSLAGNNRHWEAIGPTSIYFPSTDGFRIYIKSSFEDLDPAKADSRDWHIQWCGVKK
jgi:hypothetical protein